MKRLLTIWKRHPILSSGFLAALALTLFFGIRTVTSAIYWADPAHHDQPPQAWMTPGYIAHSWSVPRAVMQTAIGPLPENTRPTLKHIALDQNIPLSDLISRIEAAILAHRAAQ